ncbi:cell division protein FtsZ [Sphingobium sufflavum]|uniref:cell division protein FtsZ n=1 Tax=Sphingobium sufflavum TaxID=1129547 RepID=UPI001F38057A|nr:cell division protein FtsZ [Sphingobium sufflavum]MCE7795883.1 cell division protein FtsZ [Sphingobium sufflavum]
MSIEIGPPHVDELKPRITVIGAGGAGGNAIANMIAAGVEGVDFVVANTDAQALNASPAERRIQLGPRITEGLGAGSRPDIGRAAAEETIAELQEALEGVHMCFIAAGMGGGTGTGAAPVIAKAAKEKGVLTVGVVTKPFTFEGNRRSKAADAGIEELQKHVDTLIVIPNQNLFLIANPNTTFKEAFEMADEVLQQGVRGITDLMIMPGLINLDFADVRSVMEEMGKAMMGTGEAEGDGRALAAAEKAIANPLLDGVSMRGAKGVIVSIVGGEDMRLMEVDEAANHIRELVDPDANIIWGSAFNENLNGKIRVSVVATGIDADAVVAAAQQSKPYDFKQMGGGLRAASPAAGAPSAPVPAPTPLDQQPFGTEPAAEAQGHAEDHLAVSEPVARAPEPVVQEDVELPPVKTQSFIREEAPVTKSDELFLDEKADGDFDALDLGSIAQRLEPEQPAAPKAPAGRGAAAGGGTLFERMSLLARGGSAREGEAEEEKKGEFDVPRFLNRQNNQ